MVSYLRTPLSLDNVRLTRTTVAEAIKVEVAINKSLLKCIHEFGRWFDENGG
jgi:hypothetical protein